MTPEEKDNQGEQTAEPNGSFIVKCPRAKTIKQGWAVLVTPVWNMAIATDPPVNKAVVDVDTRVVELSPDTVTAFGGKACVRLQDTYISIENLEEDPATFRKKCQDAHDLRSYWFATSEQALQYESYITQSWANPAPWVLYNIL